MAQEVLVVWSEEACAVPPESVLDIRANFRQIAGAGVAGARDLAEWRSADGTIFALWSDGLFDEDTLISSQALPHRLSLGHQFGSTDARSALSSPLESVARDADGRFALIELADTVRYLTDPAGLYPLYSRRWFERGRAFFALSNRAPVLRLATDALSLDALRNFLALGCALDDETLYANVRREPPGVLSTVTSDGSVTRQLAGALSPEDFADNSDAIAASEQLMGALASGLATIPGQEWLLQLTGGNDSRLVLSALLRRGERIASATFALPGFPGYPLTEDIEIAAMLARELGFDHKVYDFAQFGQTLSHASSFETLRLRSPGNVCLSDAIEFDLPVRPGLTLIDGVGGELGRGSFDYQLGVRGDLSIAKSPREFAENYVSRMTYQRSNRPLIGQAFLASLTDEVSAKSDSFVSLGFAPEHLNDVWFLKYLATWHGSKTSLVDPLRRVFSPLVSRALWPHYFSYLRETNSEPISRRMLAALAGPHALGAIPVFTRGAQYGGAAERLRRRAWLEHRRTIERSSDDVVDHEHVRAKRLAALGVEAVEGFAPGLLATDAVVDLLQQRDTAPARVERVFTARLATLALHLTDVEPIGP